MTASRTGRIPPPCESGSVEPDDIVWMELALLEAAQAEAAGEVPVGAVVVRDGQVIAKGQNRRESWGDPLAHAEVVAIREAARSLDSWRLEGCCLYVTLEPCAMCAGALVAGRVSRLVFGARDPKGGFCGSLGNLVQDARLNHRLSVVSGVLEDRCSSLLRQFFRELRADRAGQTGSSDKKKEN